MDAEKNKKLQQYSVVLAEKAQQEEKEGRHDEAIKLYLKLVDVFLVLAAETQDHNQWLQYIRQAEAYQARTRSLVPGDQQDPRTEAQRPEPPKSLESSIDHSSSPLKKILKPFQRTDLPEPSSQQLPKPKAPVRAPQQTMQIAQTPQAAEPSIPVSPEIYQRVLSENKLLRDKVSALTKERDEQVAAWQRKYSDLEARLSEMVPRADYDALQTEFDNSIPKGEYERIKTELLNTVPRSYYDDLLNKVSDMVPKQTYLDAERRALELEGIVRNSVPKKMIDDLASEVSLLSLLSEVPLDKVEEQKLENEKTEETRPLEIGQA